MYTALMKPAPWCQRSLHYTFPFLALFSVAVLKNIKLQELTFRKPLIHMLSSAEARENDQINANSILFGW